MIIVPIGSYFATVHTVFNGKMLPTHAIHIYANQPDLINPFAGNSSMAGGMAAVLANVVLISYIIVAMKEDQTESKPESKKTQ